MSATIERPQNIVALERANRIRLTRTAYKREVKSLDQEAGKLRVAELIENYPIECNRLSVVELLRCITRYERTRALKLMRRAKVSERVTLGNMTERQRENICKELRA